jgi:hypothetical protein
MPINSDYGGISRTASRQANGGQLFVIMAMWSPGRRTKSETRPAPGSLTLFSRRR